MNSVDVTGADCVHGGAPGDGSGLIGIWGDIRLKQDAVLQAKVRGNVHAERKLILTSESEVSGWVQGGDVCVQGRVEGGVEARGQVWIQKGATLGKQCIAQSLRIEVGADFRGELRVGGGL
ncbi:polymer-forming cytoskeletal protein [bacterium]|nr:polymer-forming cytoskeletal protein [bacterium]